MELFTYSLTIHYKQDNYQVLIISEQAISTLETQQLAIHCLLNNYKRLQEVKPQ